MGGKKSDGTALTFTTQENVIKKTYYKRFEILLDFDFFKHPVYPSGFEEDLTITIELNSAKEMILCTGETNAIYKISDINLEYDGIFDISYATSIREIYSGRLSIPYTKLTSIHYWALSKKDIVWKIDLKIFLASHCRVYFYYFFTNMMTLPIKMKNFIIQALRKF